MPPTFINGQSLTEELDLWSSAVSSFTTPHDNVRDALKNTSPDQLHQLLRLVCTFPITSCETERSVNALRRLKTYLRSTMGQERMSSIALIHSHYTMDINYDEIIARFYALHPRRVAMEDILKNCHYCTFYIAIQVLVAWWQFKPRNDQNEAHAITNFPGGPCPHTPLEPL